MPYRGPKATDGFSSFWCDYYTSVESAIARELGDIPKKMVKRRDVTARIKVLWAVLPEDQKIPYAERDQR